MSFEDDIEFVGQLIDDFARTAWRKGVAEDLSDETCVPLEMHAGEIDDDGWVEWKVLPSTLRESDLLEVEQELQVQFPPIFRAYLLARFHLFDDIRSRKYDQQIFMTAVPSNRRLEPLRTILSNWAPLIDAGYVPFVEWGDGWGGRCVSTPRRAKATASVPSAGSTTNRLCRWMKRNAENGKSFSLWRSRFMPPAESFFWTCSARNSLAGTCPLHRILAVRI